MCDWHVYNKLLLYFTSLYLGSPRSSTSQTQLPDNLNSCGLEISLTICNKSAGENTYSLLTKLPSKFGSYLVGNVLVFFFGYPRVTVRRFVDEEPKRHTPNQAKTAYMTVLCAFNIAFRKAKILTEGLSPRYIVTFCIRSFIPTITKAIFSGWFLQTYVQGILQSPDKNWTFYIRNVFCIIIYKSYKI